MKKLLIVSLIALTAIAAFAEGGQEYSADRAEFIVNNATEIQSLDPSHIQGVPEHRVYMALFEGLTINDPVTSSAVPGLAKSWTTSADGKTVTFKLRDSVWSDGMPVTA